MYRAVLDEDKLYFQFKRLSYDILVEKARKYVPEIAILLELYTKILARSYVFDKKREYEGLPPLSKREVNELQFEWKLSLLTEEELQILKKSKLSFIRDEVKNLNER